MNKKILLFFLCLSTLTLSACATNNVQTHHPKSSISPQLKTSAIDKAMEKALAQAESSGNKQEILAMLGQIHARNPDDPIVATRYGRALREDDQINAAARTLEPFTKGKKENVEAITEMAMVQLAQGEYKKAKSYAAKAADIDPKNARAYLAMGTAQDALGDHQNAEISFRQGLKHWHGDPSPILNNLALNLASQGHLEEALALLEKAQKLSPRRMELERNRRIISTLLDAAGPRPPAPNKKPDIVIPETAKPQQTTQKKKEEQPEKKTAENEVGEEKEQPSEEKIEVKVQGKSTVNVKLKPLN